jgi:voltage-gated potassium channel
MTLRDRSDSEFGAPPGWRGRLHEVIFGWETPAGRLFDVALILAISLSVLAVMLESIREFREAYTEAIYYAEWFFTVLFTVEYGLRLVSIELAALKASVHKIAVFMATVLILVTIVGSMIYFVEGADNGFTSIPRSIYWAIVTVTTVGYGDISPQTVLGQLLASLVMLMGYAIIAVPTGIVTVELARLRTGQEIACPRCGFAGNDSDARFCKRCGERMTTMP